MTGPGLAAVLAEHGLFAEDNDGLISCVCNKWEFTFFSRAEHRAHVESAVLAWLTAAVEAPEVRAATARAVTALSGEKPWREQTPLEHATAALAALPAALALIATEDAA